MRDAFGGEFMIRLMLVFIVVYVAFTAVSLNYAKAFRIKNKVISFIEENEINNLADLNCDELGKIIINSQYTKTCKNGNGIIINNENKTSGYCCNGVLITSKETTDKYYIYTINTYADWNVGALNMILTFGGQKQNSRNFVDGSWEISGEAKVNRRKEINPK